MIVNCFTILQLTAGNYGDMKSIITTQPPDLYRVEMATEFSTEDDSEEYYNVDNIHSDWKNQRRSGQSYIIDQEETTNYEIQTTNYKLQTSRTFKKTSRKPTFSYINYEVTAAKEHSIIDSIIEESEKSQAEKLLEKIESSKVLEKILHQSDKDTILEQILPRKEETDRKSLLSQILGMFR